MRDGPQAQVRSILIAALGGEGGGVLMNWIVDCAIESGLPVQSTSVPGVAQRTGSTSYYIEIGAAGTKPVFALVPMPGRVDVVIASELAEAARMMERGFVSPQRTTLIAATGRVLTTAEKSATTDGRFPSERIIEAGTALAARFLALDLAGIATRNGTIVSATMFGALAGAGLLPWSRATCEGVIRRGRGAAASLAGFAEAHAAASGDAPPPVAPPAPPAPDLKALGAARCADFQDAAYAALFRERVRGLEQAAGAGADPARALALEEATRRLALWMTYEDIPRVADLKTRRERFARIRAEAEADPAQVIRVTDLFKPGAEEIAAMLPAGLGRRLLAHHARGGRLPLVGRGLNLRTSTLAGYVALRAMAAMGRLRRRSLRFEEENAAIEAWLAAMRAALPVAPAFAAALAELPRVLKGYGETQARGLASYRLIFARIVSPALARGPADADAPPLREAIKAAFATPDGTALARLLDTMPAAGELRP